MIAFTVFGKPAQMGSKRAFMRPGMKAPVLVDDNSAKRKQWAGAFADKAAEAMNGAPLVDGPVYVDITFYFARPGSHFGSGKNAGKLKDSAPTAHAQSPDLDKLVRCALDAMTGTVYRDDKQVCSLRAGRCWTEAQEQAVVIVTTAPWPPAPHWPAILEFCRAADTTWRTAYRAYSLITGEDLPRFAVGSLVNGRDIDMRISEATEDDLQDAGYPARVRELARESVERLLGKKVT